MTITSNEADRLMNFATFIYIRNSDSCDVDEATEFACDMFKQFAAVMGITDVCTDENEYCEFCELCEHCDECKDRDEIDKE